MARATPTSEAIEATILDLLAQRSAGATICPSEAARALSDDDAFRSLMEPVRAQAAQMAGRGALEVTQRDEVVNAGAALGPIRLRLPA